MIEIPLVPTPKQCDPSVKKAIQILTQKLGLKSVPIFGGLTLTGKLTAGSFASPLDVTNTREYGFELHYSGNNYNVTGIRSRAQLVTTDTTATAQGAVLQAANNDGIDAGVLNGALIEAIGKSNANASTISMMRGCLVGCEWGGYDTVTTLHGIHIRIHTRNNAGAGSFGTACALTIENEAVGGNGQAVTNGIQFVGTNLSAGNKAFNYGIDFGNEVEYGLADMNLSAGEIHREELRFLKEDNTNFNIFFGTEAFDNADGVSNVGIGYQAGYYNSVIGGGVNGTNNVYIGLKAGYGASGGNKNQGRLQVGIGVGALLSNSTGYQNVAIGISSLGQNTTGHSNIGIGPYSLRFNTQGFRNLAFGHNSLRENITGDYNVGIGYQAGAFNETGNNNISIGYLAGYGVNNSSNISNNVFIGYESGLSILTGGNSNVFLGYQSGYRQTTNSDRLIIDNRDRSSAANEITTSLIYGIFAAAVVDQSLRINGEILGSDGAKIGDGGTTNYTEIETDGTIKFYGAATVWEDLQFTISDAKVPAANFPAWETFTTNTKEYSFAINDYIDTKANEMHHAWKLGTNGHVHLHITTKVANSTGSNRYAKFTIYLSYCDTGEAWQETSLTAELTIPDGTSALQMFYLDMGDLTLTNYVMEAEIKMRVSRIAATGGTEYAGNIFLTQAGIHLEHDTIGSRAETTK